MNLLQGGFVLEQIAQANNRVYCHHLGRSERPEGSYQQLQVSGEYVLETQHTEQVSFAGKKMAIYFTFRDVFVSSI